MTETTLDTTVATARALGHPARVRIVAMLRAGELCACQITEVLDLAASTVSAHLRELKRAGLITERKDGRWVYFGPARDPVAASWVATALAVLEQDPRLAADTHLVDELRRLPVADLCRLGYQEARRRHEERTCSQ